MSFAILVVLLLVFGLEVVVCCFAGFVEFGFGCGLVVGCAYGCGLISSVSIWGAA